MNRNDEDAGRDAHDGDSQGRAASVQAENDAMQDRYLRLAAEFDNYRKRTARDWNEQKQRAAAEVLREMLELSDNLERALQSSPEDAAALRRGVELIHQQLQAALKRHGVETMDVVGKAFDPTQEEAVLLVDSDQDSQTVVNVVRPGYRLHGELLRPARVTVAR